MSALPSPDAIAEAHESWLHEARASDERARVAATSALTGLLAAVEQISTNLEKLSYPSIPGARAPRPGVGIRIERLERKVGGSVPPLLRLFWEIVGSLSLVDLKSYSHTAFWRPHELPPRGGFCDGVHIDGCDTDFLRFTSQDFDDLADDPDIPPPSRYPLSLSPDGYHKDNISGGASYEMQVGGGWTAPLQNFAWAGPLRPQSAPQSSVDLLGYLRTALLECAGFPGLYGAPEFQLIRARLLHRCPCFERALPTKALQQTVAFARFAHSGTRGGTPIR